MLPHRCSFERFPAAAPQSVWLHNHCLHPVGGYADQRLCDWSNSGFVICPIHTSDMPTMTKPCLGAELYRRPTWGGCHHVSNNVFQICVYIEYLPCCASLLNFEFPCNGGWFHTHKNNIHRRVWSYTHQGMISYARRDRPFTQKSMILGMNQDYNPGNTRV